MTPLASPATLAVPASKLVGVAVPKATSFPEASLTVGVLPSGLAEAPL